MNNNELSQEQRTNREISNANLIQFKPGESGNPGGKRQGKSITAELRKLIDSGTIAEEIALVLLELAKKGNRNQVNALKELLDRTDGKVLDTHRIEGDVPVVINYILKEKKDAEGSKED